jgi:hypothetical protein
MLTRGDKLRVQGRFAEVMRAYNAAVRPKLQRPQWRRSSDVQYGCVQLTEACSMLEQLADQHTTLVERLLQALRLTVRAGEVIREMRSRGYSAA